MGLAFNGDTFLEKKFLQLKDKHKITRVIETGTYHGDTTEWFAENFEKVITIEANKEYYDIARKKLVKKENVFMIEGDSSLLLRHLVKNKETIIFLDAHWYANPVIKELEQIKESGHKPVIVIHDFKSEKNLDLGYDIYPEQNIIYEWSWIKEKVEDIYGDNYTISYNNEATGARRGCIFIEPIW